MPTRSKRTDVYKRQDEDGDAFAKFAKTGANANAFTSFDRTCYLFTATQQLDESLDVLLGMVGHPYFTEHGYFQREYLREGFEAAD